VWAERPLPDVSWTVGRPGDKLGDVSDGGTGGMAGTAGGGVDRRALLGAGALTGLLAACGGSSGGAGGPAPAPTGSVTGSAHPSAPSTPSAPGDYPALAKALRGRLYRPGADGYAAARQLADPRFDGIAPAAVAMVASPADVTTCLAFARATGTEVAVRSGGHSYAGYSTGPGLVVDVSALSAVDAGKEGVATVGAGARLIDVYSRLAAAGKAVPAGSCPTVGIAGLAMGGGIGVLGRRYGLTCDRMVGAQVVLPSGELVQCDANRDSDLFWALRGAGAGNFGVVVSFQMATHQAQPLVLFSYRWPATANQAVVAAWFDLVASAPDDVWTNCVATTATGVTPRVSIGGVSGGTIEATRALLAPLVDAVGVAPTSSSVVQHDHLSAMMIEAGCAGRGLDVCHRPGSLPGQSPTGAVSRVEQLAGSSFIDAVPSAAGIGELLARVDSRRTLSIAGIGGVILDSWGGAINRVGPAETAFVHRKSIASAQYITVLPTGASAGVVADNRTWLSDFIGAMGPYFSASAYQNYIDPNLADWRSAYYGANYSRLTQIKAHYDPDRLFHYAQAIGA
jgi:FAD binding domain/Berberine and berberine like